MGLEQLDTFMAAMRRLESGSFEGNYTARNLSGAYGAYQIMPYNWPVWSAQAGYPGASASDPKAQDAVARYKLSQYYQQYKDWNLVAVAWFAGGGAATALQKGDRSILNRSDGNATVSKYIDLMNGYMTEYQKTPSYLDYQNQRAMEGAIAQGMSQPPGGGAPSSLGGSAYYWPVFFTPDEQIAQFLGMSAQEKMVTAKPSSAQLLSGVLQSISNAARGGTAGSMVASAADTTDISLAGKLDDGDGS